MKKVVLAGIFIMIFIFTVLNVYAKDTVYSLNKYEEEKFSFILDSYNAEGKKDGLVAAGEIYKGTIESTNDYDISQVILVKYNYNGDVVWELPYGKLCQNTLNYLEYTYDENGNVNGYLIVMPKTFNISDSEGDHSKQNTFIKVTLDGKIAWEKESPPEEIISITKIMPTLDNEKKVNGYISIGKNHDESSVLLIKYDLDLNVIWLKKQDKTDEKELEYEDLEVIYENNDLVGYSLIRNIVKNDNSEIKELIKLNSDGEEEIIINSELNKYISTSLAKSSNGIIIYGLTDEVKLKKDDISYYIIKYNNSFEEEWETIGEEPIIKDKVLKLKAVENKEKEIEKYIIMYSKKSTDEINTEVAEIDLDGFVVKKIKKIISSYYKIETFNINDNVLYFVGQINCPADDDCEYNNSSLFLISDEDKVIEVKDNTSRNILLIISAFIIIIILGVFIKKRRAQT